MDRIGEENELTFEEKLALIREERRKRRIRIAINTIIILTALAFLPSVLKFIAKIINFFNG